MKKLKVKITKFHLANGRQCSQQYDPISLALRGMGFHNYNVGFHHMTLEGHKIEYSPTVLAFVRAFDDPIAVTPDPCVLEFEVPFELITPRDKEDIMRTKYAKIAHR